MSPTRTKRSQLDHVRAAIDAAPGGVGGAWVDWVRTPARPPDPNIDPAGYHAWRVEILGAWADWEQGAA